MSFLLPIAEYSENGCMFLPPDGFTPELIGIMALASESRSPCYALWGGGGRCTDLILSAIISEADNRSLRHIACRSPIPPHRLGALWVEKVGLFVSAEDVLPAGCRLIDLSQLSAPLTDEDEKKLSELSGEIAALTKEGFALGSAAAQIESAAIALASPCHSTEALAQKAARIASAQPAAGGRACTLPIASPLSDGTLLRLLPFDSSVRIIGLREHYGIAARFLSLLSEALNKRSADSIVLTERWSGNTAGIWLPCAKVCYLTDPPEAREKLMTISRFLLPRPSSIRSRYRALEGCQKALALQLGHLTGELASLQAQIDRMEERALKKSRLGEFRKRLLIELFCK